jgi:hypothetical protein
MTLQALSDKMKSAHEDKRKRVTLEQRHNQHLPLVCPAKCTATDLGLPGWPGPLSRAAQQHSGSSITAAFPETQLIVARRVALHTVMSRLLTCPEEIVLSLLFDGAKMANGCVHQDLLQTIMHVMFPLQVPLMCQCQEQAGRARQNSVETRSRAAHPAHAQTVQVDDDTDMLD